MQDVEKILQKVGLSEKESKVFLATLDLGPSSVQNIAKKAGVNRATTYVMIEWLIQKGLMSSFQKGKKQVFTAEPPENLKGLLRTQENDIKEKLHFLEEIFPNLKSLYSLSGEKPSVKFYEGMDGIRAIREDFLRTGDKQIENIIPLEVPAFNQEEKEDYLRRKIQKGIKSRVIYPVKESGLIKSDEWVERRGVPADKYPFTSEIVIYGKKVAIYNHERKPVGVIIENASVAETMRAIFNLAWEGTEKYQK